MTITREEKIKSILRIIGTENIQFDGEAWSGDTKPCLMIGDVLDYCDEKGINIAVNNFGTVWDDIGIEIFLWNKTNMPIEKQEDQCIDGVYSLIPKDEDNTHTSKE